MAARARVDGKARDLQVEVDDLTREQRKADADVEQVKARRVRDQQRLDRGMVTNPKDLERLQHELVSLDRRISDLEDAELEVMERLEAVQIELGAPGRRAARHWTSASRRCPPPGTSGSPRCGPRPPR